MGGMPLLLLLRLRSSQRGRQMISNLFISSFHSFNQRITACAAQDHSNCSSLNQPTLSIHPLQRNNIRFIFIYSFHILLLHLKHNGGNALCATTTPGFKFMEKSAPSNTSPSILAHYCIVSQKAQIQNLIFLRDLKEAEKKKKNGEEVRTKRMVTVAGSDVYAEIWILNRYNSKLPIDWCCFRNEMVIYSKISKDW